MAEKGAGVVFRLPYRIQGSLWCSTKGFQAASFPKGSLKSYFTAEKTTIKIGDTTFTINPKLIATGTAAKPPDC